MSKRLLAALVCGTLFTLVACGSSEEASSDEVKTKEKIAEEVKKEEKKEVNNKPAEKPQENGPTQEELDTKLKQETEATAGTDQSQQQIQVDKVKEIIEDYSIGENDTLNDVSVENDEIKATIVLASNELVSAKDMAVSRYSQLSDELLNHEGWQTLTVTYTNIGSISMNRTEKETNELGDYFPSLEIEKRLK
ncbi:hypothetical protein BAMA111019_00135 [Bacillus manliponensis]|nr:hypothetical protein [Bacillus manliponensis]